MAEAVALAGESAAGWVLAQALVERQAAGSGKAPV
jgi:hypothetical protein